MYRVDMCKEKCTVAAINSLYFKSMQFRESDADRVSDVVLKRDYLIDYQLRKTVLKFTLHGLT